MNKSTIVSILFVVLIVIILLYRFWPDNLNYREDIIKLEVTSGSYKVKKNQAGLYDIDIVEDSLINNRLFKSGEHLENVSLYAKSFHGLEGKVIIDGRYDGDNPNFLSGGTYSVPEDIKVGTYRLTLNNPPSLNEMLIRINGGSEVKTKYVEADFPIEITLDEGEELFINTNQTKAVENFISIEKIG